MPTLTFPNILPNGEEGRIWRTEYLADLNPHMTREAWGRFPPVLSGITNELNAFTESLHADMSAGQHSDNWYRQIFENSNIVITMDDYTRLYNLRERHIIWNAILGINGEVGHYRVPSANEVLRMVGLNANLVPGIVREERGRFYNPESVYFPIEQDLLEFRSVWPVICYEFKHMRRTPGGGVLRHMSVDVTIDTSDWREP